MPPPFVLPPPRENVASAWAPAVASSEANPRPPYSRDARAAYSRADEISASCSAVLKLAAGGSTIPVIPVRSLNDRGVGNRVAKDAGVRSRLLDVYALAGEHAKIVTVCREQLEILRMEKDAGELTFAKVDLQARLGDPSLYQQAPQEVTALKARLEAVDGEIEDALLRWEVLETRAGAG